jgi:ketosteroid isomerase-like protein
MSTGTSADYAALIGQFGAGWSAGDAEQLVAPFADDALFVPDAFANPVRGTAAIREYWSDIPNEQAEVSFRHGELFVAGPWFATEFKCTFRRRRTGELVDIRGALFCETANGRISEMRMYWHRSVGGAR